jgi:uncharacterized protein
MQNPFVWYDVITSDVEAAKSFYGAVLGWTFTNQRPDYVVVHVDGAGVGGIMQRPDHLKDMPPFWSGYIHTPDLDAACAELKSQGGKVYREPWDIAGVARMAVVSDPTGAAFNIMQPLMPDNGARPAVGAQGTVGWNELHAGDLGAACTFYESMFGWQKSSAMEMGGGVGTYQMYKINGEELVGMMKASPYMPMPAWLFYFNVDGIDAAISRIQKAGGNITMGPHEVPGGNWIVMAQDPQGAHVCFLSKTK